MDLYGLDVNVIDTQEQFSFTPRMNDDSYPLSNIKTAIIRLTQQNGNYSEISIENPTKEITLEYSDFYKISEGTYILTLRVTDTSDNLIIFPNLNSIVADVTDSSISIEGNVLSALMVNDIYNKMKSEVIQGATGPQGPKGDTGAQGPQGKPGNSATININSVKTYTPITSYDSSDNQSYSKGYLDNDKGTVSSNDGDISTDFFNVSSGHIYSLSLPSNLTQDDSGVLKIAWYDTNKSFLSMTTKSQAQKPPFVWSVLAPEKATYARISAFVDDNSNVSGSSLRIIVTDIGQSSITNSGDSTNASLDFRLIAGQPGVQGLQGPIGETGPQGNIGNYITSTGWLDLTPYMNKNLFTDLWRQQYCILNINGYQVFKFRIHAHLKPNVTYLGQTLFTCPPNCDWENGQVNLIHNNNNGEGLIVTTGTDSSTSKKNVWFDRWAYGNGSSGDFSIQANCSIDLF